MPQPQNDRPCLDVSELPTHIFGHRNINWLGNMFYMTIEGTMFALLIASYFYLRIRSTEWPPGGHSPPDLRFGLANAVLLMLSVVPARFIQRRAANSDREAVQLGLILLIACATVSIVLRAFEFRTLQCRWTDNAYASMIWVLLGMHTGHLITECIETAVITAISFTNKTQASQFVDADVNSDYWYFVVIAAMFVDALIYGTTRWL
jgi:cytochrome c oxidase subunit 3